MLPTNIPFSTTFIFLLAAMISFLTSLANRLLTDPKKSRAWRKEVTEWNAELRKARSSGDKKQLEKVMKKQQYIVKLQSKMFWQSLKVTLLFFIPLILMWQLLGGFYYGRGIAYFPGIGPNIPLPILGEMPSLYWWYLLCSFFFGTTFQHLLGIISVE